MKLIDNKERLVKEVATMRQLHGDAPRLRFDEAQGSLWWEYELPAEGRRLPIKIVYPKEYPASPPDIVINTTLPSTPPHFLSGNRMCWISPHAKRDQNRWDPAHDTAALCINVARRWFVAYLVWQSTGVWPVRDANEE